jgi:hypothetical protein
MASSEAARSDAAPRGNNEKIVLSNTIFAGQSAEAPVMWLDRKQYNNPNGAMKENDLKKRVHWNYRDAIYEPPTHLSEDMVEPDQGTMDAIGVMYKDTKGYCMDWGRTRVRSKIVAGLRDLGVTDENSRPINTFKNFHNYIQ